jgi:hypothetical protein
VRGPPAYEDVSPGAGERPLAKTQQTEDLVRAVLNCRVCELAIVL